MYAGFSAIPVSDPLSSIICAANQQLHFIILPILFSPVKPEKVMNPMATAGANSRLQYRHARARIGTDGMDAEEEELKDLGIQKNMLQGFKTEEEGKLKSVDESGNGRKGQVKKSKKSLNKAGIERMGGPRD
jgi:hypothetical protein